MAASFMIGWAQIGYLIEDEEDRVEHITTDPAEALVQSIYEVQFG